MRAVSLALAACVVCPMPCEADDPTPPIVGTWKSLDRHVAMGSIYQPVHGVRQREGVVTFQREGDQLNGFAVCALHKQITNQERWKEGRTQFRKVTFSDNRLTIEFDIEEWVQESRPLLVASGRVENKGTIRIEAVLDGDRLAGAWKMFLADGSEVFRGEWEATRVPTKKDNQP